MSWQNLLFMKITSITQEDSLNLTWKKGEEIVTVVLTKGEKIYWRIFVNAAKPVMSVDFPIFKALPANHDLLLGWQNGSVVENFVDDFLALDKEVPFWMGRGKGAYINEYPAGISYQYTAYYGKEFGFYFVTEDTDAYIKTYSYLYNKKAHGMDYVVTNYPENAGIANVYYMPYDFVADTFTGDWRDATLMYRQWATQQAWCGKKLKDKKLKRLYQEAIDRIREDHTVGEAKSGDLSGVYGYDIFYNKTNYELAYRVEYVEDKIIVVIMAGTRENFYDELKRYMKG